MHITSEMDQIILSLDIGSSSIRCSAYKIISTSCSCRKTSYAVDIAHHDSDAVDTNHKYNSHDGLQTHEPIQVFNQDDEQSGVSITSSDHHNLANRGSKLQRNISDDHRARVKSELTLKCIQNLSHSTVGVQLVHGSLSSRSFSSTQPITGEINIFQGDLGKGESDGLSSPSLLFDLIDSCVDETLMFLRNSYFNDDSINQMNSRFTIVGLGFSTFVMNMIGIDLHGNMVGNKATMSYACNSHEVIDQCNKIQLTLGRDKIQSLYYKTGTPIHSSYALPQLCYMYESSVEKEAFEVSEESTKSALCLHSDEVPKPKSLQKKFEAEGIHFWQTISSLCLCRWTGRQPWDVPISYSEASWTGLLNYRSCRWEEEALELLPPKFHRQSLPSLADFCDSLNGIPEFNIHDSTLTRSYCDTSDSIDSSIKESTKRNPYYCRWPELHSCRLFLGVGDGASANIGSKCTLPERIAVTIGTSAAARICVQLPSHASETVLSYAASSNSEIRVSLNDSILPLPPPGLFCYRIDANRVLIGGALSDGGNVIQWIRNLLHLDSDDTFQSCLETVEDSYQNLYIACNDVSDDRKSSIAFASSMLVPFFSGERSTGFRQGASGAIVGLTHRITSTDLVRCCMEGILLRIREVISLIKNISYVPLKRGEDIVSDPRFLVVSGNALDQNILWRKMLSDCTQLVVIMDPECAEGSSRGVAMLVTQAIYCCRPSYSPCECYKDRDAESFTANSWIGQPRTEAFPYWSQLQCSQDKAILHLSHLWY